MRPQWRVAAVLVPGLASRLRDPERAGPGATIVVETGRISGARRRLHRLPHRTRRPASSPAGAPMPTPFGTLYSSNITPDRETGIGKWTADDFYAMMHTGRFPDGGLHLSGDAVRVLHQGHARRQRRDLRLSADRSRRCNQPNRPHDLRFPYNNRSLILGWRTLFFTEGEYKPDPGKSAEWNRGAYLVEGLAIAAMCHSPINALGGSRSPTRSRAA